MSIAVKEKNLEKGKARIKMREIQAPIRKHYYEDPGAARIVDKANTHCRTVDPNDPFYATIAFHDPDKTELPISLHKGVGGNSDLPVPGELLCGAIAGCMDSVIRVVANHLRIKLKHLEVSVSAHVDLRGTLRMDPDVPVGFDRIDVEIELKTQLPVPGKMIDMMISAAEQSCVVLQTLRNPPQISVSRVR